MYRAAWTPMFIREVINAKPRDKVYAEEWNARWNLSVRQGDNNTEGLEELFSRLTTLESFTAKVGDVDSGVSPEVTITGTYPDLVFNFVLPQGPQ